MEVAEVYEAGGSFRRSRNANGEEDDEESLKWAAIQRLPTYDRLKKGLLGSTEIDVSKLGLQQRRTLLDRLVRCAEEDNERFLLQLKSRIQRVGIELPTIEVRFQNVSIETEAHVGSRALPTFLNYSIDIVEGLLNTLHILPSKKRRLPVLENISGIIKPRRMTLLLGPPSSGKTTLLLALAGKLDPKLKFSGRVTYNGHEMSEFVPQRTAAYISQHDTHIPEMTVRETLEFSARCQGIGHQYEMVAELLRREKESNIKPDPDIDVYMKAMVTEEQEPSVVTDYVLKILGLEVCADIVVGNQMLRGISGGQKKRLTTGEMLVGPAKALFMDDISTGLDSSTTYQIVNSIRQYIHILNGTAVISLLQPAPETYDLFDDIILLSDGQIVYHGTREHVLEFFEYMGFKCPERKGVADFLQEVTSRKDQQQYWANKDEQYSFISAKKFSEEFRSFHVGQKMQNELLTQFDKAKSHPAALVTKKYGVKKLELLKACFSREFLLMKRNSFVYRFKLTQVVFMAFVAMTVFFRGKMHRDSVLDGGIYVGAFFYSMVFTMYGALSEISLTVSKLPVFYKQRDLLFYPPWAFSLPPLITKLPLALVQSAVWVLLTYYVIGYDPDVGRLVKQYIVLVLISQVASGLFRFVAAAGRNMVAANTYWSSAFLAFFALAGFALSRENIKKWWIWGYWVSPLMYGQNAMVVNEFLGKSWSKVLPNSTEPLGVEVLKSRGFFTHEYWYWIGVGGLVGFTLLYNLLFTLALTFLAPLKKQQAVVSMEDPNKELRENGIEMIVEESCHQKKGIVLPFEPHYITFNDIKYSVDMPQEMKNQGVTEEKLELLRGVSGCFRPGVLTALMGVSGAGKTTLMDVLAGRKTGGYIEGNITISGYPKKQETFARISGYCEQNDIHSPNVTVYESLVYSAWLRLSPEVISESRMMFVEEVMELVELKPLRKALVGLPGVSGLSTEQRKRLTIAVELVANPSIIFMDEPTSGLDARAAAIVMRTVRNTVDTGRTVVCTIHQPSIDIFEAFDELFFLKQGGQEIYAGPLGHHSNQLIQYFEDIQGVPSIKNGCNPATWMLEVTSASQEMVLGVDFAEIYRNSELCRKNKARIEDLSTPAPGSKDLHFPTQYSQSFITQCMACLWKQHWSYWRNPPYTAVRFLFTIFAAFMYGTMFWNLGSKTTKRQELFNAIGSMYLTILFLGVKNASSVQPIVAVERTVFYRERAAGMYSAFPYAFAQVVIELPYVLLQAIVYGVIVYAMMGFEWTAAKFLWYLFFMYFKLLIYTFYGMMAVAVTPNLHVAAIASSAFYTIWNLFSGFIIPRPRLPVWWRWYAWLCPTAYTLYGLVSSQFGDVKDTLESGETVEDFIRSYFDFRHELVGAVAVAVVGFATVFALIFAYSILFLNFQRR